MHHRDQRRHPRTDRTLPAKLRIEGEPTRFVPGRTRNVSAGGVLLEVAGRRWLRPGQRVSVGLAAGPHDTLLRAAELRPATVLRVDPAGRLAVCFDAPETGRVAA